MKKQQTQKGGMFFPQPPKVPRADTPNGAPSVIPITKKLRVLGG